MFTGDPPVDEDYVCDEWIPIVAKVRSFARARLAKLHRRVLG